MKNNPYVGIPHGSTAVVNSSLSKQSKSGKSSIKKGNDLRTGK